MRKIILLLLIYSALPILTNAQTERVMQSKWVKIMEDESSGNYFEAQIDFHKFYTSYQKKKVKSKEESNNASPGEEHIEGPVELLIASYLKWCIGIKAFVQPDGSIMPIEQRMAIINQARKSNANNSVH